MHDFKKLFEAASEAMKHAYAPYSHFHVGACIETINGKLFTGCNVENASYGLTICAESSAVTAMATDGERQIVQIAVLIKGPGLSAACGACRQRLNEFSLPDTLIHLCNLNGERKTYLLADLLPHAFGPKDLSNTPPSR